MNENYWVIIIMGSYVIPGWFLSDIIQDTDMPEWLQHFTLSALCVIYSMIVWNILMRLGIIIPD